MKRLALIGLIGLMALYLVPGSIYAQKVRFGTASKLFPIYYLPVLIAQDQGFWKESGLDIDYISFRGGTPLYHAVSAGELKLGIASGPSALRAASAGVPLQVVAQVSPTTVFQVIVRADSSIKNPKDLKGARFGISRLGALTHIYAQAVARALGIEKDIKMSATGGVSASLAALKTGSVDAVPMDAFQTTLLEYRGEARSILDIKDYIYKDWAEAIMFAEKKFVRDNPDSVKRAVAAIVKSINFIKGNRGPVIERIKSESRFPSVVATKAYDRLSFSRDGKINRKGLENVTSFLIEYGLIKKGKAVPVNQIYTDKFLR